MEVYMNTTEARIKVLEGKIKMAENKGLGTSGCVRKFKTV